MNEKKKRMLHRLLLPLFCAVLLTPGQVSAEGYSCSTSIPVEVGVSGERIPDGMEYQVVLEALTEGAPMPEKTVLTIRNGGKAEFGPISYTVPEDYQYKVYQREKGSDRFTYDAAVYTVTVRVTNDAKGGLRAEIWAVKNASVQKTETIRFENSYRAPDPPKKHHHSGSSETTSQTTAGVAAPQTGDSTNMFLWMLTAVASLAGIGVWLRKRLRMAG